VCLGFFEAFTVGETPTAPKFYINEIKNIYRLCTKKRGKKSRKVLNP
jgi:hypothetical protein